MGDAGASGKGGEKAPVDLAATKSANVIAPTETVHPVTSSRQADLSWASSRIHRFVQNHGEADVLHLAPDPTKPPRVDVPKPQYENPGHHDTKQPAKYIKGKSPLPADAQAAYANAVPDETGTTWWAKGAEGIYRYQGSNGKVHWNGGSQFGEQPPPYVKKRLAVIK